MRALLVVLCLGLGIHTPSVAWTAEAESTPAATPSPDRPTPVPPTEIGAAAEQAKGELREIQARLAPEAALEEVVQKIRETRRSFDADLADAERRLAAGSTLRGLLSIREQLAALSARVQSFQETLMPRAVSLQGELERLDQLEDLWRETRAAAQKEKLPADVVQIVDSTLAEVSRADDAARDRRSRLLSLQGELSIMQTRLSELQERVSKAHSSRRASLLRFDSDPLWRALLAGGSPGAVGAEVYAAWTDRAQEAEAYLREYAARIVLLLAGIVVLALALLRLGRLRAAEADREEDQDASLHLLQRPFSTAIVAGFAVAWWALPARPDSFVEIAALIALVPVLRLLPASRNSGYVSGLYGLAAVAAVGRLTQLAPTWSLAQRLLLLVEGLFLIAWLVWFRSPKRLDALSASAFWRASLRFATGLGATLIVVAIASNVLGNISLGEFITTVVFGSVGAAVVAPALLRIIDGLFEIFLRWHPVYSLRSIRMRQAWLRRSLHRLLRVVAVGAWILATAALLGISDEASAGVRSLLGAAIEVGNLRLSVGGGVAFFATLWLAVLIARAAGAILEQDLLPRLHLPRGIPYAIALVGRYALLLIGVLLASSAAGIDVGRITIVLGALGVGVGLGLQNVVSNFVSGLILIFERPFQVGDTLERGALTGEVGRIGIRSSTLRTVEGAEVIVPNEKLVADEVINWTLSDKHRRIELEVGAAYGSDPRRVLSLLMDVAASNKDVLEKPLPTAFFLGFGDNALNFSLRCWVDSFEDGLRVRSELALAVYDAMKEAGIEIPFPQRDVHVRSIDGGLFEKLGQK